MHREDWRTWSAAFDAEWRDEVDPPRADDRSRDDVDDFVTDIRELAQFVVECAIEPLRSLARTVPDAFAFDARHWRSSRHWPRGRRWRWYR